MRKNIRGCQVHTIRKRISKKLRIYYNEFRRGEIYTYSEDCLFLNVWAKKGVIAVTLNYRLGPLGFTCLPELKEEAGHTGNYGLYDQMTALQWVKGNTNVAVGE